MSPLLKGGPELDNLHVFIPALAFYDARSGLKESGDKSVTETNTTALDLSSLSACSDAGDLPMPAAYSEGMKKMPLSQRRAAWCRQDGPRPHRTPCTCPCSHPCMHAPSCTHTLPSAACSIAPPSQEGACFRLGTGRHAGP